MCDVVVLLHVTDHYVKTDVIHKTGSALPSEENRATCTGNVYRQFGEIWTRGL